MNEMRPFPVLNHKRDECPESIPWFVLDEEWAKKIHYQTLEQLASRGGLCAFEIALNYNRLESNTRFADKDYPKRLVTNLSKRIAK